MTMRTIEVDETLADYIVAARVGSEAPRDTLRRLLKLDEAPVPAAERPLQEQPASREIPHE